MTDSPPRFPRVVRSFAGRFLRILLFAFVCLATLAALFYAEEDVRGKRAWNAYARQQAAKGEKLSLAGFIPAAVPDDQNLALCPLLKPILDIEFQTVTQGKITPAHLWRDTNGMKRLGRCSRIWSVLEYRAAHPATNRAERDLRAKSQELQNRLTKPTLTNGWIDLEGWKAYYRTGTNLDGVAETTAPALEVLRALRSVDDEMAQLQQEASRRPLARWPIFYETNAPWGILLPHLAHCKGLIALLQLRSAAHLAAGDTEAGFSEIELAMRLAETVRDEPFLVSHLVRNACYDIILQVVKEGLALHQFTDIQLAQLQKELGAVDVLAGYELVTRAERAWNCEWNRYAKQMSGLELSRLFGNSEDNHTFNVLFAFARYAPSGWVYQNQLRLCRVYDQFALPAMDVQARRVHPEMAAAADTDLKQRSDFHPFGVFARLIFPLTGSAARKFAHTQTQLDEAGLACALERHRLVHGSYPDNVQALVPRYIEHVPQDLFSGQPLQYSRTEEGHYVLSSAGWSEPSGAVRNGTAHWFDPLVLAEGWGWQLPGAQP